MHNYSVCQLFQQHWKNKDTFPSLAQNKFVEQNPGPWTEPTDKTPTEYLNVSFLLHNHPYEPILESKLLKDLYVIIIREQ